MGRAKDIIVKVIPAKIANEFVRKHHYSGKVAATGLIFFGAFLDNKMIGVAQWGRPINKYLHLHLVENTKWNDFLELNRMVFDDYLPKYSESRCIAISIKLIKKNAPQIKWIVSYADAIQCGDGTIYRASGFYLTSIKKNTELYKINDKVYHTLTLCSARPSIAQKEMRKKTGQETGSVKKLVKSMGGETMDGKQLRYIYLIDKTCKITVPIIPFSKIDEMGAGMYKGEKITMAERKE